MSTAPGEERSGGHRTGAPLDRIAVVIPAWRPNHRLPALVSDLLARGISRIVVVDDGSGPAFAGVFAALELHAAVQVHRHTRNFGKGRALKTAFASLMASAPGIAGVVTADADGQHRPEDILRVARALLEETADQAVAAVHQPVLGLRSFTGSVPWRSKLGNAWTCRVFAWLTGVTLPDTQTGLRGLPMRLLPALLPLSGERYEFEMAMLLALCKGGYRLRRVLIETVYLEGNRGSHFHPLRDSIRVYTVLVVTWFRLVFHPWPHRTSQPVLSRQQPAVEPALHSA